MTAAPRRLGLDRQRRGARVLRDLKLRRQDDLGVGNVARTVPR
jgi:hypothetical protein